MNDKELSDTLAKAFAELANELLERVAVACESAVILDAPDIIRSFKLTPDQINVTTK